MTKLFKKRVSKVIHVEDIFAKYSENWGNGEPLMNKCQFEIAVLEILDFLLKLNLKKEKNDNSKRLSKND